MTPAQERALNLAIEAGNEIGSTMKLQMSLATGAIVLFVHLTTQLHQAPVRCGILLLATLFFGFSAVNCIKALLNLASFKAVAASSLCEEVERRGDLLLERSKNTLTELHDKLSRMDRYFDAGIAWSVLFMVAQFIVSFRK